MTRKRFVKCLMALGCPRNDAQEIAAEAPSAGVTYSAWYGGVVCFMAQKIADEGMLVGLIQFLERVVSIRRTPYYGKPVADFFGGDNHE